MSLMLLPARARLAMASLYSSALADGLRKNRGVRSHAGERVLGNQSGEMPVLQPAATNVVEPDALTQLMDLA